eukprot:s286_g9.t1
MTMLMAIIGILRGKLLGSCLAPHVDQSARLNQIESDCSEASQSLLLDQRGMCLVTKRVRNLYTVYKSQLGEFQASGPCIKVSDLRHLSTPRARKC